MVWYSGHFGRSDAAKWLGRLSAWCVGALVTAGAAEISEAQSRFQRGDYAECLVQCQEELGADAPDESWSVLAARCQLTLGQYPEAQAFLTNAIRRHRTTIRLRLLAQEVLAAAGETDLAQGYLKEIDELGSYRFWDYQQAPDLVALGQAALRLGVDPKLVLDRFLEPVKRKMPEDRHAYLAIGELALGKNDYALAAKTYTEGLAKLPNDPDLHLGLARAYAPSERAQAAQSIERALGLNPRHVPSLLLLAEHAIDAEEYDAAEELLGRVWAVNPGQPEGWALRAVMRQLDHELAAADQARATALRYLKRNPAVDHLIGRKLSQKYRFREGAAHQRLALELASDFLPAKIQLAQDLLRLGEEAEGWRLAGEVHQQDGYDVTAFNLVTLRDKLAGFTTLTNRDFRVRMERKEAALYGDRVLQLLDRARADLPAKYGLDLSEPTAVEIYPEQKDFAVRTFGMPDNPGFLGVCFGSVITANSPASQAGDPANWEAVLWHEFCHVVTLRLTRNRMPRWLSEGISVYEESQANPAWGHALTPKYRELILADEFTPLSQLSGAFLKAKSSLHVQFAYYQSAVAVEFLVQRYGRDCLAQILHDLGAGQQAQTAMAARTAPFEELDRGYAEFLERRARSLGAGLDWEKPEPGVLVGEMADLAEFVAKNPTNYWAATLYAQSLLEAEKWAEAEVVAQGLAERYPENTGAEGGYALWAAALRGQQKAEAEREVLEAWAMRDADNLGAFLRLGQLAEVRGDWPAVERNAERLLAVNPLLYQPYRLLALASEELAKPAQAAYAWERALLLEPPDPAEAHYRLARALHQQADPRAKRHVLEALAEAPRYRDAHKLLLELTPAAAPASAPSSRPEPGPRPDPAPPAAATAPGAADGSLDKAL